MGKNEVIKTILSVVAVGGLITLAAVAPNAVQLLKFTSLARRQLSNRRYYINRLAEKLIKRGLMRVGNNSQGQKVLRLTSRGRQELEHYKMRDKVIVKPKRWDGKYRVIIFDIKEWKKKTRNNLRYWLGHLGFVRLQNSVWVHPYECQEVVALLKSNFKIGNEVLYLTVESVENDRWLKKEFGLTM